MTYPKRRNSNPRSSLRRLILGTIAATAFGAPALADDTQSLGNVSFQTSCAPEANAAFNKGLRLLHHMMYLQAEGVFGAAAENAPDCTMLHWGGAMTKFHPLWPGRPGPEQIAAGQGAIDRMNGASAGSDIEQAFAQAVRAYYEGSDTPYPSRIAAWAEAQAEVCSRFPENVDATAFCALGLLATAPRGDTTLKNQREAGEMMEALNERTELHPGVYHYAIHAYDNPVLYEKGLPFAEEYGKIAPDVAHALHMPSHIFVRAGRWDDVIDWNVRSANAALAHPLGDMISAHYAHAMDYRIYGHLQRGEFEQAEILLAEFIGHANLQSNFGSAYALAAAPVRVALEQEQWGGLSGMDAGMHAAIDWGKFPQTVAIRWFAIGLGAARSGDLDRAAEAVGELAALRTMLEASNQEYWLNLTAAQMLTIEAWTELARGNDALAVSLQTKAADIEDAAGKSPVTPGHVLPARELLGDLLSKLAQDDAASVAYEAALAQAPNRRRSRISLQ